MSLNALTGLFPGGEGRGFSQDVLLLFKAAHLASELCELLSLGATQTVIAFPAIKMILLDPAA
jgi:hypothetical protein